MHKHFIHLGLHKTGSTYLQRAVFPNYQNIHFVSRPFTQYNHSFNKLQYADDSIYDSASLSETLNHFEGKSLLISDENLSGKIFGYSYINRTFIADRLAEAFKSKDYEVIVVLRGQRNMLNSLYDQWVKSYLKGDRCIDEFIWYPEENFTTSDLNTIGNGDESLPLSYLYFNTNKYYIHLDSLLYYELIKTYQKSFKKVHFLLYETLRDNPNQFLQDLDNIINLPRIEKSNLFEKINPSLEKAGLYERVLQNRYKNVAQKIPLLKKGINIYCKLTATKRNVFEKQHEESLIRMANYYKKNNEKIIKEFPEIGIQNYPGDYVQ